MTHHKHINLMLFGTLLIDLDEKNAKVNSLKPNALFDKDFAKLLESKLSVENLFTEIENYQKFLNSKR